MAKRYVTFQELVEKGPGYYKPSGTLGSHCYEILVSGNVIIVRGWHTDDTLGKKVVLLPGDTLGYNCGELWVLTAPKTPLEKLRRKKRIHLQIVKRDELPTCSYYSGIENNLGGSVSSSYDEFYSIEADGEARRLDETIVEETEEGLALNGKSYSSMSTLAMPNDCVVIYQESTSWGRGDPTRKFRKLFIDKANKAEAFRRAELWAKNTEED